MTAAYAAPGASESVVSSLFSVPLQYQTSVKLSAGIAFEVANLCEAGIQNSLTLAVRSAREGYTWLQDTEQSGESSQKVCLSGTLAPLPGVQLSLVIEGCWEQPAIQSGALLEPEESWSFKLRSVLRDDVVQLFGGDEEEGDGAENSGGLYGTLSDHQTESGSLDTGSMDEVNANVGWQIARRIMLSPAALLTGIGAGGLVTSVGGSLSIASSAIASASRQLQANVRELTSDVGTYANSLTEEGGFLFGAEASLTRRTIHIAEASVEIRRSSGHPWTPSFAVTYVKRSQLSAGLQLPSLAVAVSATGSLSSYYNLGDLFSVLFDARARPANYYDCCLLCLQLPNNAFCREREGGAPSCMTNFTECADPDAERVVNITECGSQSDSGSGGLPRQHRDSGACLDERRVVELEVDLASGAAATELGDGGYMAFDIGDVPWELHEEGAYCSTGDWRNRDETFEECVAAADAENIRYMSYRFDDWNCRLSTSCNVIIHEGGQNVYISTTNQTGVEGDAADFNAADATQVVGGSTRTSWHVATALGVLFSFVKAGFN